MEKILDWTFFTVLIVMLIGFNMCIWHNRKDKKALRDDIICWGVAFFMLLVIYKLLS